MSAIHHSPPASRARIVPIFLAQAIGMLCGVLGIKVNSHLIPPALLGTYGAYLTLTPLGMWVVHAGIVKFVARHWAAAPSRPALLRAALGLWARRLGWLALAALAGSIALGRLAPGTGVGVAWAALFCAAALLSLASLAQQALQAERAHWRDCLVSAGGSLTRTFVPPLALLVAGASASGLFLGFGAHALLTALAGLGALRVYWKNHDAAPASPTLDRAYRGPLFVALAAAGWLLAGLNRWVVAGCFGEVEAGYFTLAGGAAVVVSSTLGTVFVQYFQPGLFALGDAVDTPRAALGRKVDLIAALYNATALLALALLAWLGPWLVGPLIAPAYRDALAWLLPAGCFGVASITLVFFQVLLLAGRREAACAPTELTAVAVLAGGCLASAAGGREWFIRWLLLSPLVPWLLARPMARHFFMRPDAGPAPAPGR